MDKKSLMWFFGDRFSSMRFKRPLMSYLSSNELNTVQIALDCIKFFPCHISWGNWYICMYVKSNLPSQGIKLQMGQWRVWLEFQREGTKGKLVGVCYRTISLKDEAKTDILAQLALAAAQGNVVIKGDFDYPVISWADGAALSSKVRHFLNVLRDNFMCQLVDAPTRKKGFAWPTNY